MLLERLGHLLLRLPPGCSSVLYLCLCAIIVNVRGSSSRLELLSSVLGVRVVFVFIVVLRGNVALAVPFRGRWIAHIPQSSARWRIGLLKALCLFYPLLLS